MTTEVIAVRPAHAFDSDRLEDWCVRHVIGFRKPLIVRQFQGGQSNPTYLLTDGAGRNYVLRRKPPGKLLASAHAVDREFRIMRALAVTNVPVPNVRAYCDDSDVLGTPFYVMDHVEGRIFRDPQLPGIDPEDRAAIYDSMNDVLARLHKVDVNAVGLGDYGKPGNYFARQTARWIKQYRDAQTDVIPSMESLIAWMPENIPADDTTTIAHGDYRLENTIFHPTEPRLIAVLDWELSTLGHPLADLAYNCMLYHLNHPTQGGLKDLDFATLGIPAEDAYVAAYCKRTGRSGIENWPFYLSFAIFRLASIAQGVYKRGLDGTAASANALERGNTCQLLSDVAWDMVR